MNLINQIANYRIWDLVIKNTLTYDNVEINFRNKLKIVNFIIIEHLVYYPTSISLSYFWSFGSLAGIFLVVQLITGIILVIHYKPSIIDAFDSIIHLIVDVPSGWLIRYSHANGASIFFILVYIHIARGLYYGSYIGSRSIIWISGVIIFLLLIATAFIGYVLPWGQISLWGATVITNLISAIPFIGENLVIWIWGNFSIGDATLNRFFSLHYLLPFIILVFVCIHLFYLHSSGSGNPIGVDTIYDIIRLPFYPFFYSKDIFGGFVVFFFYFFILFFEPNILGHADNYILANPIVTPVHIVPEWYFLPFYAILRSIPNKFGGVIAIVGAIIIIIVYATLLIIRKFQASSIFLVRSLFYYPMSNFIYWIFIYNFFILGFIGGRPVEIPYLIIGQFLTLFFFLFWIIFSYLQWFEFICLEKIIQNKKKHFIGV